jgi:hypothetical protein
MIDNLYWFWDSGVWILAIPVVCGIAALILSANDPAMDSYD